MGLRTAPPVPISCCKLRAVQPLAIQRDVKVISPSPRHPGNLQELRIVSFANGARTCRLWTCCELSFDCRVGGVCLRRKSTRNRSIRAEPEEKETTHTRNMSNRICTIDSITELRTSRTHDPVTMLALAALSQIQSFYRVNRGYDRRIPGPRIWTSWRAIPLLA